MIINDPRAEKNAESNRYIGFRSGLQYCINAVINTMP